MADSITITLPEITAVTIAPNPANAKEQITLTIKVIERSVTLEPEPYRSGEVRSGET